MTEEEKARKELEENKANAEHYYKELQKCLKNQLSAASKLSTLKQKTPIFEWTASPNIFISIFYEMVDNGHLIMPDGFNRYRAVERICRGVRFRLQNGEQGAFIASKSMHSYFTQHFLDKTLLMCFYFDLLI